MLNGQIREMMDIVIKMLLALLCGGILGIERERKKRPAGFRTYMLVCLGSTLAMMINQYIFEQYGTGDPARMGSQVISGIGFLGAGTIIVTGHNRVKGLTTAAGLWAAACIGLAIGIEFYPGAIIGSLMIFLALVIMHSLDGRITTSAKLVLLCVELEKLSAMSNLVAFIKENDMKLIDIETEPSNRVSASGVTVIVTVRLSSKQEHEELLRSINEISGVVYVEEI